MSSKPQVTIVGGGMITQVQILPTIYHLQRTGKVGDISICALNSPPLKVLAEDASLKEAYPGQSFTAYPALDTDPDKKFPELFKEVVAKMPKRNIVLIALPDQLHYPAIKVALANDQHVCCVKPLVLKCHFLSAGITGIRISRTGAPAKIPICSRISPAIIPTS